jgi:D-hydroxyproline dehydrogenase subunit gamma
MGVCFECTMTINGVPNTRACMTEVQEGMIVETDDQG